MASERLLSVFHHLVDKLARPAPTRIEVIMSEDQLVQQFSGSLLNELGVFDNQNFGADERNTMTDKMACCLLESVFAVDPRYNLDGKSHHIRNEHALKRRFPSSAVSGPFERAIYLEARNILLTMITPQLRSKGMLGLFIEDFISSIEGKPRNHFNDFINLELKEGVGYRIEQLVVQLEKFKHSATGFS